MALVAAWTAVFTSFARGDEGMWLPDRPPLKILQEKYNFQPTPAWLEHAQKSAIKFGGASASFVSPDGLVLTNHHVGSWSISKLSTPGHNLLRTGFYAPTRGDEVKCPGLDLNVLWSIEDVTDRVIAGTDRLPPAEQFLAQRPLPPRLHTACEPPDDEMSGADTKRRTHDEH